MKTRITRDQIIDQVAESLPFSCVNDIPAIRMAANDTADMLRKEGNTVPDFKQDRLVAAIQDRMKTSALYLAEHGVRPD